LVKAIKATKTKTVKKNNIKIIVGLGTCGIAAGALDVYKEIESYLKTNKTKAEITQTSCIGMCYKEPLVEIITSDLGSVTYGDIDPKKVSRLLDEHIVKGQPVDEWVILKEGKEGYESDFLKKQHRIVLRNCGRINPESIDEYITNSGYQSIQKVLKEMSQEQVIEEIKKSGLKGRGGAGFPTGLKWEFAYKAEGEKKYIICNADEGDPGAFMDRAVLEGDPHSVLEGMLIGGYAVGADTGYIYARAEYPLAIKRLKIAIEEATKCGYIGENILGSSFNFEIKIKEGAGAFVCGEETALIASIEGKRGTPRMRPPFPAISGLWGKPTNVNNVETFANIAWIILNGADKYNAIGTEKSKGTKVFSISGKIKKGGLIEVPIGTTLKEVIFDIAGGIRDDIEFKAVQIGGPTGGCLTKDQLDYPIDYETLISAGAAMGSGGMVVMDKTACMVDISKFFLSFTQRESCGKCVPCRIGTKRMLEILTRITRGQGEEGDVELLEVLAKNIKVSSLCGLGQTAPNPVLSTLRYFGSEYEAHIKDQICPANACDELVALNVNLLFFKIDPNLCKNCGLCVKHCASGAIEGSKEEGYRIDENKCTKCRVCLTKCPFKAIEAV
jgi:NADH-quinone oxidoreductase subunit F